jgi:glycosyltransferase 2 family protein
VSLLNFRNCLKITFGVSLTAFFVFLLSKKFDSERFIQTLDELNFVWLMLGFICLTIAYVLRIFRWQILISDVEQKPHILKCAVTFLSSIALNNTLPLRAGDAFRAFATANWLETKTEKILAAMLFEKIADLITLLLLLFFIALFATREGAAFLDTMPLSNSALFLILVFSLLILLSVPLAKNYLAFNSLKKKLKSIGLRHQTMLRVSNFFLKFKDYLSYKRIFILFGISITSWAAEIGVFVASAFAIPELTERLCALIAAPIGTLSTLLPSTPGYVGTFHYAVTQVAELAGNDASASLAFAFVVHLMLWIPTTICGAACFVYWGVGVRQFQSSNESKILGK